MNGDERMSATRFFCLTQLPSLPLCNTWVLFILDSHLVVHPHRFSFDFCMNIFSCQHLGEPHVAFSLKVKTDEMLMQLLWGVMSQWTQFSCLTFAECLSRVSSRWLCTLLWTSSFVVCICYWKYVRDSGFFFYFEIFRSLTWIVCQILQRPGTIVVVMRSNCFYVQLCKLCLLPVTLPS